MHDQAGLQHKCDAHKEPRKATHSHRLEVLITAQPMRAGVRLQISGCAQIRPCLFGHYAHLKREASIHWTGRQAIVQHYVVAKAVQAALSRDRRRDIAYSQLQGW